MSVAVKTRRTERLRPFSLRLRPDTPRKVLRELRPFILKPDEELVDITKTDFYKKTKAAMTPGDYLRELREANGLTLHEVGERLSVSAQYVHDMQSGTRGVSKDTAKRLGELFGVSPAVFI